MEKTQENVNDASAPKPKKLEVKRVIARIPDKYQLMAKIMYGGSLQLMECIRHRVKDLDFEMNETTVRDGKGRIASLCSRNR